ncbi:unnamed protein product [Rangifer tarandus platyrhynchus]|uniref:Uncharacterized protein n=1 Tax=Rangifer tarandus platyrhynchus TaxID=3082113 RepID=A0ABN9A633_RANTA|nr:unnamed protein product [Rangifer tarandus platyrhynchus]
MHAMCSSPFCTWVPIVCFLRRTMRIRQLQAVRKNAEFISIPWGSPSTKDPFRASFSSKNRERLRVVTKGGSGRLPSLTPQRAKNVQIFCPRPLPRLGRGGDDPAPPPPKQMPPRRPSPPPLVDSRRPPVCRDVAPRRAHASLCLVAFPGPPPPDGLEWAGPVVREAARTEREERVCALGRCAGLASWSAAEAEEELKAAAVAPARTESQSHEAPLPLPGGRAAAAAGGGEEGGSVSAAASWSPTPICRRHLPPRRSSLHGPAAGPPVVRAAPRRAGASLDRGNGRGLAARAG